MAKSPLPLHPRLADHALPRRHVTDGYERVVIYDTRKDTFVEMSDVEWDTLACADGTRTFDGIVLAAAQRRLWGRASVLRELLEYLHGAGLIAEGVDSLSSPPPEPPPPTPPDRPLDVLPGFSLTCSGRGTCCSVYYTIHFTRADSLRARLLFPEVLDGLEHPERVFSSEHGSAERGSYAVAMVDGHCAYLADNGLCSLHVKGGPAAKPDGCRNFPVDCLDDGEVVRVSARAECPCIFASVGVPGGTPLVDPDARTAADLPGSISVLPLRLPITRTSSAPREEVVAWSRIVAGAAPPADPMARMFWLGEGMSADGLDPGTTAKLVASERPVEAAQLRRWVEAFHAKVTKIHEDDVSWRSPRDRARVGTKWLLDGLERLLTDAGLAAVLGAPADAADERFYVASTIHGLHITDNDFAVALRERAMRMLAARALRETISSGPEHAGDREHPIAVVEQLVRARALHVYASNL